MVDWGDVISTKLAGAVADLAAKSLDALIAVLIVLFFGFVGYFIASIVNKIIQKVIEALGIEAKIKERGLGDALAGFTFTELVTSLLKIYIVLVFLGAAADAIKMPFFTQIIQWALIYLPNLVQGVAIIVIALLFGSYLSERIRKDETALSGVVASVVQVFVAYVAVVMSLPLILPGVNITILERAFELFVGSAAVAVGLGSAIAIGLGLKEPIAIAAKKHRTNLTTYSAQQSHKHKRKPRQGKLAFFSFFFLFFVLS